MVTARFTDYDYAMAPGLWQYDYGQLLRIEGLSLDPTVEVHFSIRGTGGEAEIRIGKTEDRTILVHLSDNIYINKSNVEAIDEAIAEAIDGLKIGERFDVLIEKDLEVLDGYLIYDNSFGSSAYHSETIVKRGEVYHIKAKTGSAVISYVIRLENGDVSRYGTRNETWGTEHDYDVIVTINDSEDNGTLFVNTIDRNYIGLKLESKPFLIDGEKIQDDTIPISKLKTGI